MDRDKEDRLQNELLDGEVVEWRGEPKPSAVFSPRDLLLIPFSICWCSVTFLIAIPSLFSTSYLDVAAGLFFVLLGLFMLFGRWIVLYFKNKSTLYIVTNWRILFLCKSGAASVAFQDISEIKIKEKKDGSGSLSFSDYVRSLLRESRFEYQGPPVSHRIKPVLPFLKFIFYELNHPLMEFKAIGHVNEVYRLICEKTENAGQPIDTRKE